MGLYLDVWGMCIKAPLGAGKRKTDFLEGGGNLSLNDLDSLLETYQSNQ